MAGHSITNTAAEIGKSLSRGVTNDQSPAITACQFPWRHLANAPLRLGMKHSAAKICQTLSNRDMAGGRRDSARIEL